jgi:hypothetical protein
MPPTPSDPNEVVISRAELLWLTLGTWVGGVCLLTVLPVLLIPRLGIPAGTALSYLVFFAAWHPVQRLSQRGLGMGTAVVRMLAFVSAGAAIAYYLRELLFGMARSS